MTRLSAFPRARSAGALVLFLLLTAGAPRAQARITGTVTDALGGAPLRGAVVRLEPTARAVTVGSDGRFDLTGVPPGTYTLRATRVGYEPAARPVVLRDGEALRADLALDRAETRLGEAVVEGRAASLVGTAQAASQGRVGQDQIAPRPLLRVGEVLEAVPGLIVTQHSGSGKANQFFLRGFNLDHGTDFSASVEGVPMNLPTHGHGQGWLDLNFLIPELIERISFAKGPYDVRTGDFSTAGSAQIRLARRLDAGIARVEGGTDEYVRVLAANSVRVGPGDLLLALNTQLYNGPWVVPEASVLLSGVAKYSAGTAARSASVTAMAYHNRWTSTDQIARRAVASGRISDLGTLDSTAGGQTDRYTLVASTERTTAGNARTTASAYAAYYNLNLFSNFTYFLNDPVNGDQFEQADRRVYGGATVSHRWSSRWVGQGNTNTVGADLRHDQILDVGLFNTSARRRVSTVRRDDVAETSLGAYAETDTQWTRWLRTTMGLRGDVYRFGVTSDIPDNSGTEAAFIASPRLSVAVGPWRLTEGYLNLGLGFHSNDARGTTIRVDPLTGEPAERVDPLVRTRGAELGARTAVLPGLQSTLALWYLGLNSELVFVGDAGGTEASGASEHYGAELNTYYAATDWLNLNLDVALTESHYTEGDPAEREIENSIGRVVTGGIYAGRETGLLGSLQLRYFGPRPLSPDGGVRSEATSLLNARAGYRFRAVAVALDVLNVLDSDAADVSYFYPSRLQGEAAETEDVHFHPVIPRTARLTLTARF